MYKIRKGEGCVLKMHITTTRDIREAESIVGYLYYQGNASRANGLFFDEIEQIVYIRLTSEELARVGTYSIEVAVLYNENESLYTPVYPFAEVAEDVRPSEGLVEIEILVDGEDVTTEPPAVEKPTMAVTYAKLEQMRQEGKLTAGAWYRITDYVTETDQVNTRSAGHAFDILVLALDERTLGEECRVIAHEGDTYFRSANLDAWKIYYSTDNNRRVWGVPTNKKQPESWSSAWGVLDSNATPQGSKGYTTAEVDGKTLYLYRPAEPTAYLEGKAFYREVVSSAITSTDGFVYEADEAPYYDEEMGEYSYPYEIRVKTAKGKHIATFVHDYEFTYYDEQDGMWDYPVDFSSDYEEVDGVYHLEPSNGINAWWEGLKGGAIEEKEREYYSGSLGAIYYAFDKVLPQSESQPTPQIYSSETGHIYRSDEWEDAVVFSRGIDGGKGVIYRLIDEFGNDLPFDFKNIQHQYKGQWYYTFGINDKSLNGEAYGNEVKVSPSDALPVYIFAGNATNNTITALPEEVCYFGSDCTRNRLEFNSLVRIETSGKFTGNSIRGTIGTLSSSKTIQDCEVLCLGSSLEIVVNADLFMCRIDVQPRNSMPLVINAGRFQWVDIRGAGYITVADANGNGKYLTMSSFNTGMNGSAIYLQETRTTSLSNRLEGLQVDILNKGNTETRIDTSSIPLNATHKTNIGINSAGEVKIWNDADKS